MSALSCAVCASESVRLWMPSPAWPATCLDGETRGRAVCSRCHHVEFHTAVGTVPYFPRRDDLNKAVWRLFGMGIAGEPMYSHAAE